MPASNSNKDKLLAVMFSLLNNQGIEEPSKERVRKMTQISAATFPSFISRVIKKDNTVVYGSSPGTLKLTQKGKDQAASVTPPADLATSNADVHERIMKDLKGKALKIFKFLSDGEEHEKTDVMKAVDCTNPKTFAPLVSRELKAKGLVEYPSKTTIRLTKDMCFPFDE